MSSSRFSQAVWLSASPLLRLKPPLRPRPLQVKQIARSEELFYFILLSDADAFYAQYAWPGYGIVGPYGAVSSTCYGCRPYGFYYGKRSAEPHGTGVAVHPGLATSFNGPTVYGYPSVHYGKRDAEPHGAGVAVHPGVATSFRGPTVFGFPSVHYGKRSAQFPNVIPAQSDLSTSTSTGGFSGYGKREADAEPHGTGVAFHPFGVSHVGPTVFGYPYYGKRSAEPHGLGVHPGYATSYVGRTIYGYPSIYGKRSAEADPHVPVVLSPFSTHGYGPSGYGIGQLHPGAASSFQSVTRLH